MFSDLKPVPADSDDSHETVIVPQRDLAQQVSQLDWPTNESAVHTPIVIKIGT